jgi:hypothetical protein
MVDDPLNRLSSARGERCPQAQLTEDEVRNIRGLLLHRNRLLAEARTLRTEDIARKFDVNPRTIERIAAGETWTHVS